METLVQTVIAKDLAARKKVAEVEAERSTVKKRVEAERDTWMKEKRAEAQKRLDEIIAQNEQELADARVQKALGYEAASKKLKADFEAGKEKWLKELVERCLHG